MIKLTILKKTKMKTFIYKTTLILFLLPLISFGNTDTDAKHEKSKTLKKEYSVSSDATVKLNNKYGNLNIITWNKNRVEITVTITVKGNNLKTVMNKLDDIDVEFKANADMVSAKTKIPSSSRNWSLWGKSNKESYQINYTVKMPVTNNVDLNNKYGNIQLNELKGAAKIDCDYGKLIIGELQSATNSINIDYCKNSTINYMKLGNINADYSKLTIDKTSYAKINSDYSNISIENANKVTFNADYGSITVNDVKDITGNADYVGIKLGKIRNTLNLKTDYGSIKISELVKGFTKADISSKYTGISIGTKSNNSFNFSIDLSYGSFKRSKSHVDLRKSIVKSSKKYYEGSFGRSNNASILTIKSEYGSVSFKQQ